MMVKKLLGLVFNRWVLAAALLLALALSIWIIGPLVAVADRRPLETEAARWNTIGALALLMIVVIAWRQWRARRGNAAVVQQLLAAPTGPTAPQESADLQAVRQRFDQALQTLRRARFGTGGLLAGWSARFQGRYLYELPWYLIIGAPGSGKTTALQNCGLKFPLSPNADAQAVRGVGGTRNCDWWFTDRAVLIDTAGRFTTQDSDRDNDSGTWAGFLALLRRSRPRQALNGVLVTVSVPDLLARDVEGRRLYAAAVRQRLQELHEGLSIRFPVYLLVTKTDLLAGFMDYFATLDKEQRAAPWGMTFGVEDAGSLRQQRFGLEFDALQRRLVDGLVERLQAEPDLLRRARIYGFPGQFAGVRGLLQEFLESVFAPSPYEAEPLLRGVYFISGTQEGTPIDRVLGNIARSYRLERAVIAPNQTSGRSYFLTRLVTEVVLAESGLAGTNLQWERRRRLLVSGGFAALVLLGACTLGAWTLSYLHNRSYVDAVAQDVERVRELVRTTPNRASPDLLPLVPSLAATRGLAGGTEGESWRLGFGLNQGPKLDSAARAAYQRMLVDAVLPRLGLRVEELLRQAGSAPDGDYEALKAYLMLHDAEHFEPAALKAYVEADWDAQLGRSLDGPRRAQLSEHLDALLTQGAAVSPLAPDRALVEFHRNRLAALSLPQRIYRRLRHQGLGNEFPDFTVARAAGSNAALVFVRASGAPLNGKGVPGLFSYDGYHRGFQKEVPRVAQQLAKEQPWVLGIAENQKGMAVELRGDEPLLDDVRRLYLNEYATTWEDFVADVRLQPMTSLAQSIQMARLLSAPDSPLPPLMRAMVRETTLLASDGKNLVEKTTDRATDMLRRSREAVAEAVTAKKTESKGPRIESLVDDRFIGLRRMVSGPEGGKAPMDDTLALIGEAHMMLNAVDTAVRGGSAPPPSPVPLKLKAEAARLPEPLRAMLDSLSNSSAQVSQIMVRQNLGMEVRSQVGEFCQQAVAGRYPLDRNSARDVTQADFALLFGPGGKIDQLFQQKLATYVDTTTRPWRFRAVEGGPLGVDGGTLPQFQRAQAIRETLFPAGNVPSLRLQFKPVEMDASLKQFILDVDGQIVRYDHGPQIPATVQWPGPRGSSQVRVQLSPPLGSGASGMVYDGPWALFRLFDRVQIEAGGSPERFRATFDVDGRKAVFEVVASSVRNPFRLRELSEFTCPAGL
ncbi:type VI secretion system membrane subunit TssM [Roseateles violae]|uniref:Type VI secretion system membrane subunit TssM n=1 Tax=Roseateles violae TaxID=3058042 RepID=A0ABT8DNR1_9BURK|nr:type VI secretion system membrane subunit TssM [Pelomonas sp. PFR6]MDN3920007.1 type VI secretion system membrane subunit TssM [Pelomonas sp. PFR6]